MGNCHCRPQEGGENVREFLARKFRSIAGKRKIDDLVTIAIHVEGAECKTGVVRNDILVEDIDDYDTDDGGSSDGSESSASMTVDNNACMSKMKNKAEDKHNMNIDGQTREPQSREEVVQYKEDNDYIRVLQQQLQQVQSELENLHKGKIIKSQPEVCVIEQEEITSARSLYIRHTDEINTANADSRRETNGTMPTNTYRSPRNTIQAQGDVRGRSTASFSPVADAIGDAADDNALQNEGRRNNVKGMVSEGLRTRSDVSHQRPKAKTLKPKDDLTCEKIAEKIARLQKRDPALPRPDKGIVYPKTMANLSDVDKAYYVEHFLRSEIFRQRCLRKCQGSKTWMNGLSPFQLWVLENEGTADIDNVLHPFARRHNNAQAKVKCWRGDTPPPPPKSP